MDKIEFQKAFVSIRYWLMGKEMHLALSALEYAHQFHKGFRKDGQTPEYFHQLSIAHFLRTLLKNCSYPEETLATAFLHDTPEDADVGFIEVNDKFGETVGLAVRLLTKKHRGIKRPSDVYYQEIGSNAISSIVKGADRVHNIQSMAGVFSIPKQIEYIAETNELILPMLKAARRTFTKQEPVYENIKHMLKSQISLIAAIHDVINVPENYPNQ